MTVDALRLDALAFGSAAFNLPQLFRNVDLGTELGNRAVDRDVAHNRIDCSRGVLCSFEVEQNLESTAHKLCFFEVDKNNFGRVI